MEPSIDPETKRPPSGLKAALYTYPPGSSEAILCGPSTLHSSSWPNASSLPSGLNARTCFAGILANVFPVRASQTMVPGPEGMAIRLLSGLKTA